MPQSLKRFLDEQVVRYERTQFIADDPVSLPRAFDDPADQEIVGLFAATIAWGRRDIVLRNMADLVERMDHRPSAFVRSFRVDRDGDRLAGFKHRTFQPDDAVALTMAVQAAVDAFGSLGSLFAHFLPSSATDIGAAIQGFSDTLLSIAPEAPLRRKHVARPSTGSACKRLAMYARWMTRPGPVDLGIWQRVRTDQLVLPLDVHTGRQARRLGLLTRKSDDWKSVIELTEACRAFSTSDPARYDYALFGLGAYAGEEISSPAAQSRQIEPSPAYPLSR